MFKEDIKDTQSASALSQEISFANLMALGRPGHLENGANASDLTIDGHKFGLPELPIPSNNNLKYRYDPVVSQVTNMMMQHGKKSVAQRVGSLVLSFCVTRCAWDLCFDVTKQFANLQCLQCRTCHSY